MNNSPRNTHLRRAAIAGAFALATAGLFAAVDTAATSRHSVDLKRDASTVNRGSLETASYAGVVKRVAPSIVKVTVLIKPTAVSFEQGGQEGSPFNDPAFRQFFGNHMKQVPEQSEGGLGSGVIISRDGYIVTNNHVVDGAKTVTVTLSDGREFTAKVVGRDPQTDVAVIKVVAKDLPAITFAQSKDVEVGDRVLAIGNPFGIGETVTSGIVSATGRRPGLGLKFEDFIQTDAAINPGNSGGALVDVQGRLVGINTAILSKSGGFQGVGLAVPSDLVGNVAQTLVSHGKVVRGYIGIGIQDLTPGLADSFGLAANGGALISDVQPDSPGMKAGLKSGDVITAINGQPIDSASRLTLVVGETTPGTTLNLDLNRNGKAEKISVTTIIKPNGDRAEADENAPGADVGVLNGVAVGDIDANARRELEFPERLNGAVVTSVDPASAAARAGIREGDVILELDRQAVTSAKTAVDLSASATNKKTLLKLWSHGNTIYVIVDETAETPADAAP
ncbi:MAG TPA: Do family serine endopeptidase [Opitutaceae bacterium]|jgi:serine protease Do|nr:Do family serine endopeptidase [Opitutaceae bacterium]